MTRANIASPERRLWRSLVRELGVQTVVLFGTAGTLRYWQAWAFLGVRLVPMVATNLYLIRTDRDLLRRRLTVLEEGETETVHKVFFALIQVLGLAMFVLAGLDHRHGWSAVPLPVVVTANMVVTAGALFIFRVFRENTFCSSVIEIDEQQTVVTTGPYRLVRHPMYTGALIGIIATPFSLGSLWAAILIVPLGVLFVVRILAEERYLSAGQPGYAMYMRETRTRLVPGIW